MLGNVFSFWIDLISRCVNFLFTLKINENPDITIGMFLLAVAFIGVAIYFIISIPSAKGSIGNNSGSGKEE